ncbi:TPA: heavy metal translocating P-type ATPase [Escherichia coli]|uniref:heavy metal translocating P-type ATPase n=1 Tax=Enterobacter hormaechei TaxID=158836 RepID=UPI0018D024D5|nr:cation-translocating P-type ATPase [Enterobacter hormaechei]HDV7149326.1 cation-translocating P-type ATPase [Yersinia enterocolitica]QPO50406.1 cation-translocating P-type ATPase [Enterobacter hormaechei]QPO55677.1 cation-translocating P-type ATPase [Enterobacter hormaechei]UKK23395.1 cation-translocating P-type ATPase [Enterobacter hormaechei]HDV7167118.1 cation-translocating P-type ATPase [Yersinia enterocolitica]
MMVRPNNSRNLQEILIFALVPVIVGALTLASWLLGRWQVGPWLLLGPWQIGPGTLAAGLALIATFFGGWQRFWAGFRDVATRRITVNVFVTVAIFVTIAAGEFLPAAVIILIMAVVGALESYTLDSTRRSIRGLLDLTPPMANVRRGDEEVPVSVAELQYGDIVIVRPGERIPVDGVVTAGAAAVNQAPITGESMPVEKVRGHKVFAGTLNEDGRLEIRTTKIGADTTLARIVHLVEEAQESKAPIQGVADRFTVWFLPTVLVLAVIGYLTSGDVKVAVAILLVACPCAFAIATPSAVAAGIANMARRAVLIKGGIFFEIAGRIDSLVVDKTGTLTLGRPKVLEVISGDGIPKDEVLSLAAIAEKYSEHPLAKAVMALARERALKVADPDEFRIEVGKGIVSSYAGQEIVVGRDVFLREQGIAVPAWIERAVTDQSDLGRTAILVARNREAIGLLSIADEVRAETVGAIASLKSLGVGKITMLTGDNFKIAEAVASQIGVDEFRAGLLPEDKQSAIKEMKNNGRIVAMVGDGINDAPALALADVGIVMGGTGADVAIEAADVTLMDGNLSRLVEFVQMSRKVLRRIKLNIFFAIIYNVIGLTLAMLGHLTPVMAVIFQEAGCVTVVLSSMLLLWAKVPGPEKLRGRLS